MECDIELFNAENVIGYRAMATTLADDSRYLHQIQATLLSSLSAIVAKNPRYVCYRFFHHADLPAVERVEARLGHVLPRNLRDLFTKVSARVEFSWALQGIPSDLNTRQPVFIGELAWDLSSIEKLRDDKLQAQKDTVFEPFWTDKLPFMAFGNGDFLAVSQNELDPEKVYYLTPADPPACVVVFNYDLFEFLLEWCRIACVCDSSLYQFHDHATGRIDATATDTVEWLRWLELSKGPEMGTGPMS